MAVQKISKNVEDLSNIGKKMRRPLNGNSTGMDNTDPNDDDETEEYEDAPTSPPKVRKLSKEPDESCAIIKDVKKNEAIENSEAENEEEDDSQSGSPPKKMKSIDETTEIVSSSPEKSENDEEKVVTPPPPQVQTKKTPKESLGKRRATRTKQKVEEVELIETQTDEKSVVEIEKTSESRRLTRTKQKTEEVADDLNANKENEILPRQSRRLTKAQKESAEPQPEVDSANRRLTRTKQKVEEVKNEDFEKSMPRQSRRLTKTQQKTQQETALQVEANANETENRRLTRTKQKVAESEAKVDTNAEQPPVRQSRRLTRTKQKLRETSSENESKEEVDQTAKASEEESKDDENNDRRLTKTTRKTRVSAKKSVETHILHNYEDKFYGDWLKLLICGYIRPEYNFDSLGEQSTL